MGALSAILAFQSLNKLSPLVVNYKICSVNPAYTLQNQLNKIGKCTIRDAALVGRVAYVVTII